MERFITLLIASLCAAPLFYFATTWLIVTSNQDASGPDSRLGVAYLSTYSGFLAVPVGFFLVWYLANRFLIPQHLRILQIADAVALVGWVIVYSNYAGQQPQRLDYPDHRGVLEVELKITKLLLGERPIDSIIAMDYCGGTDFSNPHPDRLRDEGTVVILPWETVPYEVDKWQMRVFLQNQPILFPLDLPRYPRQSTDWSDWVQPVQYQESPIPTEALGNLTLRYRFRLVPHGQQ